MLKLSYARRGCKEPSRAGGPSDEVPMNLQKRGTTSEGWGGAVRIALRGTRVPRPMCASLGLPDGFRVNLSCLDLAPKQMPSNARGRRVRRIRVRPSRESLRAGRRNRVHKPRAAADSSHHPSVSVPPFTERATRLVPRVGHRMIMARPSAGHHAAMNCARLPPENSPEVRIGQAAKNTAEWKEKFAVARIATKSTRRHKVSRHDVAQASRL